MVFEFQNVFKDSYPTMGIPRWDPNTGLDAM